MKPIFIGVLLITTPLSFAGPHVKPTAKPDCSLGVLAQVFPNEEAPPLDQMMDQLSALDSKLTTIKQKTLKLGKANTPELQQELAKREAASEELLEELSQASPDDLVKRAELAKKLKSLDEQIEMTADTVFNTAPISSSRSPISAAPASLHIDSVTELAKVQPTVPYQVPNSNGKNVEVVFTPNVIKDLQSSKLDARVSEALLQALKNGIVGANSQRGIKLMKTSEKIAFAEVKTIGGVAGDFRIFGCIEESGKIVLYFIGRDLVGNNDPQRMRLKSLCK